MTPEPVDSLVERVRPWVARGAKVTLDFANGQTVTQAEALAALTELAERVKTAETETKATSDACSRTVHAAEARAEAAERERDRLKRIIKAYDSPGALGEVFAAIAPWFEAAEAERDELIEALERVSVIAEDNLGWAGRECGKVARAALAKVRSEDIPPGMEGVMQRGC